MKVHFLNVGQGDSLILRWSRNGDDKLAIIDCKNDKTPNSTIEEIDRIKPERIDFIILSHPHSDHFSGLRDLLNYLVEKKIPIDHFYTTATLSPNRIMMSIKGRIAKNEVTHLFKMLKDLQRAGSLPTYFLSETGFDMLLNDKWSMKIMGPSSEEFDTYSSSANYNTIKQDEEPDNEPKGNLLSTFLAIYNDKGYFLLTADSIGNTFHRIDKKHKVFFRNKTLSLGQIAHHGSKYNYKSSFWKNKNSLKAAIPTVISVGPNRYKHPNASVLESLEKLGYKVFTTEPLQNFKESANQTTALLDAISTISNVVPRKKKIVSSGVAFEFAGDKAYKL